MCDPTAHESRVGVPLVDVQDIVLSPVATDALTPCDDAGVRKGTRALL